MEYNKKKVYKNKFINNKKYILYIIYFFNKILINFYCHITLFQI